MSKAIKAVAAKVVEAACEGGRSLRQIADYGIDGDAIVATLAARQYEDHDDCLAAALDDVASKTGLEDWQLSARWDDETERNAIEVVCVDRHIEAEIINEANRRLEAEA